MKPQQVLPDWASSKTNASGPAPVPAELPQWKSLDELFERPEGRAWLSREFPEEAATWTDEHSRRAFLKIMAASLALAAGPGCTIQQPEEPIVPSVEIPERSPSRSSYYATALLSEGFALGVLARSHQGRPVKIEGNPGHPASLGGTDAALQASILDLYDPDRSQVVLHRGRISHWQAFVAEWKPLVSGLAAAGGAGLRILTGPMTSPTLLDLLESLQQRLPQARWHRYGSRTNSQAGAARAFGRSLHLRAHLDAADVIAAFDADLFSDGPSRLRLTREFAARRRAALDGDATMPRLYVLEPTPTCTGATADVRLAVSSHEIGAWLQTLAARLGALPQPAAESPAVSPGWLDALSRDLLQAGPRGVVLVGESQPPRVHAVAHAINAKLGSAGSAVTFTEPLEPDTAGSIDELVADMRAGRVRALLLLDVNPVFDAPADLNFAGALTQVPATAHYGLYVDETAAACAWHLPAVHPLESWGDARAEDGSASIVQPLIRPLYGNHPLHDVFQVLLDRTDVTDYSAVRGYWQRRMGDEHFEASWREALAAGVVRDSAFPPIEVRLVDGLAEALERDRPEQGVHEATAQPIELVFRPDPTIGDGRFANNGWLQELPKPLTKLTWGGAALVSPSLADELGLSNGDVVRVRRGGTVVEIPVWVMPGQAERSVTLFYGNGRRRCGRIGNGVGTDVYPLRRSNGFWWATDARIERTGARRSLASTQAHFRMEDRQPVRAGTWQQLKERPHDPEFLHAGHDGAAGAHPSLYPEQERGPHEWGMVVDLSVCTGCSACVIACQAENNIPIVGAPEVIRGREMHWLRIDTYFSGPAERPQIHHQPLLCMHCEHAPCEPVCPVAATTHSPEGLNEMTYNRCIGTRYCSNNCPYKVRRFNFFDYHALTRELPVLALLQNPDVTVRSRGVMEKCTYCVQRINAARIQARLEGRAIGDGEVMTACEAACPAQAITFGNISDPNSRVSRQKSSVRNYSLLDELNTRPRTTYLAEVRHPPEGTA